MDDDLDSELAQVDIPVPIVPESKSTTNQNKESIASTVVKAKSQSHCILVNQKQKGNPLIKFISNVPLEYSDEIIPDYQIGSTIGILFLSLRYHNLNPDYIHQRLKRLGKNFELRVLLVQVDIKDPHHTLKTLTRICILADLTLMLAWSADDAGRIVENYKIFEKKPADRIMEKAGTYPHQRLVQALTSIKSVNKTDAMTLLNKFGTLKKIIQASENQLAECPGFGPRKAHKLYTTLHKNFCKN